MKRTPEQRRSGVFVVNFEHVLVCSVCRCNNCDPIYIWTYNHVNIHTPSNIYLFKVNNRSTRKRFEISSKLIIKIPERLQCLRSGVFIVNIEHISHLFLVSLLLTFNIYFFAQYTVAVTASLHISEHINM